MDQIAWIIWVIVGIALIVAETVFLAVLVLAAVLAWRF